MDKRRYLFIVLAVALLLAPSAVALAYGTWSDALRVEDNGSAHPEFNTAFLDGCPFISRDGKSFYMASDRPGGLGGIDVWVSTRSWVSDPWGAPVNVGAPVNSADNDFCPTLHQDLHHFFFVSNRAGGCGGDDIYATRLLASGGFAPVQNVGCNVNSAGNEASPFPTGSSDIGVLYFSSNRSGGFDGADTGLVTGDSDLYSSVASGRSYAPAVLVPGVNTEFADGQPNLRRDGLEVFFFSNRTGTIGGNDIYASTRATTRDVWSEPMNLGPAVNSIASETRPSLSWNGTTLYFGSTRIGGTAEGSTDIYFTTR